MIRLYGDPVLRAKATKMMSFETQSSLIRAVDISLLHYMREVGGIGLAANQIGFTVSAFIMMLEKGGTLTCINPKIESVDERTHVFEHDGCLSLPGIFHPTVRHDSVTLSYSDIKGGRHISVFQGLEAVIVQHEMDHLNGMLYIDRLGKLKRAMLLKKYRKLSKNPLVPKSST